MNEQINTIPVTEGTISISIAEYRALMEAAIARRFDERIRDLEEQAKDKEREVTDVHCRSYDLRKQNELLEAKVRELTEAGEKMTRFIDEDPTTRESFNAWLLVTESEAGDESPTE